MLAASSSSRQILVLPPWVCHGTMAPRAPQKRPPAQGPEKHRLGSGGVAPRRGSERSCFQLLRAA
eukprot:6057824-Alexandrium_andersonii.AAC.1